MKKLITFLLLLTISITSFCQSTTTITSQLKADYLKKSKHQQTTATIILLSGVVFIVTPLLIHPKKAGEATMEIVYGTITAGFLCLPVSIPFFISSSLYKKKGMNLSIKSEIVPQIQKNSFVYTPLPSLTLKISL